MIYKITNKTEKTWNGKKFIEAILIDENKQEFKVSAWGGEYDNKDEIDCELEKNAKGYWGFKRQKLEKPNFIKYKEAQIEKAIDRKEGSIHKFQDDKNWSIKVASSMNKAIDLAIAEIKDIKTLNTLQEDILKWRRWILEHWDVDEKDLPPFK